jgi:hypothetical protein
LILTDVTLEFELFWILDRLNLFNCFKFSHKNYLKHEGAQNRISCDQSTKSNMRNYKAAQLKSSINHPTSRN